MIDSKDQLLTIVDEYLNGRMTLNTVEVWTISQDESAFVGWEAVLFGMLDGGLIEVGSGAATDSELQAELRQHLRSRPVPALINQTAFEQETTSSGNESFTLTIQAPTRVVWHTEPQKAFG